jgi:hypothetical protein
MKEITPIQVWQSGEVVEAKILNAYAISVTLDQSASFYYGLLTESKQTVAQGNLSMDTETYDQWELDSFAWDWVAQQLNLTITGEYVPPVPPQPEPTPEPTPEPVIEE